MCIVSLSKKQAPDPHHGSTFFYRNRVIAAHTHTQRIHGISRKGCFNLFKMGMKFTKLLADNFLVSGKGSHTHTSRNTHILQFAFCTEPDNGIQEIVKR